MSDPPRAFSGVASEMPVLVLVLLMMMQDQVSMTKEALTLPPAVAVSLSIPMLVLLHLSMMAHLLIAVLMTKFLAIHRPRPCSALPLLLNEPQPDTFF